MSIGFNANSRLLNVNAGVNGADKESDQSAASLTAGVSVGGFSAQLGVKAGAGLAKDEDGSGATARGSEKTSPERTSKDESSEQTHEKTPKDESSEQTSKDESSEQTTPENTSKDESSKKASKDESSEKASMDESSEKASKDESSEKTPEKTSRGESSEKTTPEKTSKDETSEKTPEKTSKDASSEQEPVTLKHENSEQKSGKKPGKANDDPTDDSPETGRGFRIFGVEFAPLNTPMRRRLQTLAVMQWLLSITILPVICVLFLLMTMLTPLAPLSLAYMGWVLIFDRNTSQRGGRRYDRVRRWSLWRHYRDYFPIRLVKSAELDPANNYLIGYHPHGIISCGAFCNFGTEATGFSAKFPGIKPYLLTLRMNFFWPLLRAYFMSAGLCDVSSSSLRWILGREGGGNAAIIVVGGAQEALDARPGNYRLTLLRRKGFVRMALQTGAHLVPCFSFGENDLFRQAANPPGSWVRTFQQLFKGAMGSSPPFFYGRGVFNYTFGLLPFRHRVTTVVGAPIPVQRSQQPSAEEVDQLHRLYMDRLADLFDQHKAEHGVQEDVRLEFV